MVNKIEAGITLSEDEAIVVFEAVKADILKAFNPDHEEALRLGYLYVRLEKQFIFELYETMFDPEFDDAVPLDVGLQLRGMKTDVSEATLAADFGNFTPLKRYLRDLGETYVGDEEQADLGKQLIVLSDRIADIGAPIAG